MNPNSSQEALAQLQQTQAQSQNPNDILNTQRQQLGVDAAQQTVTGLRGAINNTTKLLKQVAPSVMGRTGSSLVTNAQATKQISNEQAPISQDLSEQSSEYNLSNQDLAQLQQRASESASGIYQGQQDKLSYAQNLYNTLYQKEQAAEQARQAELQRQEQIRQFNESIALQKAAEARQAKASSGGSFNLGGSVSPSSSKSSASPALQDVYNEVKSRGPDVSDYNATLKSANNGNARDKLKIEAYHALYGNNFNQYVKTNDNIMTPTF